MGDVNEAYRDQKPCQRPTLRSFQLTLNIPTIMLFSKQCLALALLVPSAAAWAPTYSYGARKSTAVFNYLDDLSRQVIQESSPEPEEDSPPAVLDSLGASLRGESLEEREEELNRESMNLAEDKVANYGVGDWSSFVDFNEFDGGDGQASPLRESFLVYLFLFEIPPNRVCFCPIDFSDGCRR